VAAATASLALVPFAHGAPAGLPGAVYRLSTWFWLMLAPGLLMARLASGGRPRFALLSALVASPAILSVLAVLVMLAGFSPRAAGSTMLLATAVVALAAWMRSRGGAGASRRGDRRELLILAGLTLVVVVLVAWLPMTREWWRVRSDAWFHAAVTAQLRDYGLPPEDPYFLGMPLQYMWVYHAVVLTLSWCMQLDPFRVMALFNAQALAGLTVAAWSLAGVFRKSIPHRLAGASTLLFAFNAAFWVLLPVKGVRAFIGDVRGWDELARTFTLSPFTYDTARGLMDIYFNQAFFLDKFMVATAFGFALTCYTTAWFAATDYLATRRRGALAILAAALIGMLGFHTLVGFVALVGIFGGVLLMLLFRRQVDPFSTRELLLLLGVSLACFLASTPYLYQVMHLKEREQMIPISFSLRKTASILIPSLFVLVMAVRRRVLFADRSPAARTFLFGVAAVTAFCLAIRLPGPNTYDKPGFFVFIPLSILAGFAVADSVLARRGRARIAAAAGWLLLFFLPVNAIALAACFNTPPEEVVTPAETHLSEWVRDNTPRSAVFIDDHDRVFLLVTGPRRYYWGRWAYAQQWGYPRLDMARRYHVRRCLYTSAPLDADALASLGGISEELYVVVRPEHRASGASVTRPSALFSLVFDDGEIALYRVDTATCRDAAGVAPPGPSSQELIRDSGL